MHAASAVTPGSLQDYLTRLYELDLAFRVEDFLFSDEQMARHLEGEAYRPAVEKLLIRESPGDVKLSLYLDSDLLARLAAASNAALGAKQLEDFWAVLEGVSHFLYFAWNASHDRGVRGVELELQAEVDKYVVTTQLAASQPHAALRDIHALLFDHTHVDADLNAALRQRYHDASRSAGKYCLSLLQRFGLPRHPELVRELRRFYRLDHSAKLHFIEQHQAG